MIKYKKLLLGLNVLVALVVLFYAFSHIELDPLTMVVSIFSALTTLILVNLLYFDCEKFVLAFLDRESKKQNLASRASQFN